MRGSGRVVARRPDRRTARSGPTEQGPNEGLLLELVRLELPIGKSIRSYRISCFEGRWGQMGQERGQLQVGSWKFQSCDLLCSGCFVRRMGTTVNGLAAGACQFRLMGGVLEVLE